MCRPLVRLTQSSLFAGGGPPCGGGQCLQDGVRRTAAETQGSDGAAMGKSLSAVTKQSFVYRVTFYILHAFIFNALLIKFTDGIEYANPRCPYLISPYYEK